MVWSIFSCQHRILSAVSYCPDYQAAIPQGAAQSRPPASASGVAATVTRSAGIHPQREISGSTEIATELVGGGRDLPLPRLSGRDELAMLPDLTISVGAYFRARNQEDRTHGFA
jgi:hypothetical protein